MTTSEARHLILASSSPFREELLQRLKLPFTSISPEINETPFADESIETLVRRLAEQKARKIAQKNSDAIIIGSDQAAVLNGEIIGKPHNHDNAVQQLQAASGQCVNFLTSVSVLDARSGQIQTDMIPCSVLFRQLKNHEIERYLLCEQPYQCAGSFKSEGLGVALFQRLDTVDPTSLIGLPLIRLSQMLKEVGLPVI